MIRDTLSDLTFTQILRSLENRRKSAAPIIMQRSKSKDKFCVPRRNMGYQTLSGRKNINCKSRLDAIQCLKLIVLCMISWFEASSVISITIFRASKLRRFKIPKQPHVVGRCSGRVVDLVENGKSIRSLAMAGMRQLKSLIDTTLDLADSIGASIGPSIRMTLSLVTGPQDSFMKMVDADISRLEVTPLFSRESEEIDATVRFAQNGTVTAQTISPCIAPLGQALQGIVKLVDSLADVTFCLIIQCSPSS